MDQYNSPHIFHSTGGRKRFPLLENKSCQTIIGDTYGCKKGSGSTEEQIRNAVIKMEDRNCTVHNPEKNGEDKFSNRPSHHNSQEPTEVGSYNNETEKENKTHVYEYSYSIDNKPHQRNHHHHQQQQQQQQQQQRYVNTNEENNNNNNNNKEEEIRNNYDNNNNNYPYQENSQSNQCRNMQRNEMGREEIESMTIYNKKKSLLDDKDYYTYKNYPMHMSSADNYNGRNNDYESNKHTKEHRASGENKYSIEIQSEVQKLSPCCQKREQMQMQKNTVNKDNGYEEHLQDSPPRSVHIPSFLLSMNNESVISAEDTKSMCSYITEEIYEQANINRNRNMNHTKIFDYVENNNEFEDRKSRRKKEISTFVPRYKNLTAREIHYSSLSGNDSITQLNANQIKMDSNGRPEEQEKKLPNVYPFNISEEYKKGSSEKSTQMEKLYPTNYKYVNSYVRNDPDMTLSQRRNIMNASHIFDSTEINDTTSNYDVYGERYDMKSSNMMNQKKNEEKEKVDIEKEQKRKSNPMYTDLFGRKTPDLDKNNPCEKLMSTTMQNNWVYHASDVKKYAEPYDHKKGDQYTNVEYTPSEKFHRKSYFNNDGYDSSKRLQEALQKGAKTSLQAHLQSSFQNENNITIDKEDYHNTETFYLTLYNLRNSVSDQEIKDTIKSCQAHLVSYNPDYDLLSNKRKNTAKLCIRHNKGKDGLDMLIKLFLKMGITTIVS